jgi:lysozyme family protein
MSSENFAACLAFTLKFEGGFVNNPNDPGGATSLGVTQRTLAAWRHKPVSVGDVRSLSTAEAGDIYRAMYWAHIGGDTLPKGVDLMAFDIAVNMGTGRSEQWLNETANLAPAARIARLDALRCGFWRALRAFPIFGKGWLSRETACKALALKMAVA